MNSLTPSSASINLLDLITVGPFKGASNNTQRKNDHFLRPTYLKIHLLRLFLLIRYIANERVH